MLIENPAVSLTGCLLEALIEKKIRVIFFDAKRTPNFGKAVLDVIRKNRPQNGIVQIMTVPEKHFADIEYVTGEHHGEVIESDERLIVL